MCHPKLGQDHYELSEDDRNTNCFRFGKYESIFSRLLLNFIKIQLKLAFDSIHIFGSIANQKVIDI